MLAVVGLVVVVVLVAVIGWLVFRDDTSGESVSTARTSVDPAIAEAESRLPSMLPAGYPAGSCTPTRPGGDGLAAMVCDQNIDSGGPVSGTYTMVRDKAALDSGLAAVIDATTTVECPGRIQSPGPWRRNAAPERVSGTLFCGYAGPQPVLAWTDDTKSVLGEVRGLESGPTMADLYTWWSSHS